VLEKMQPGPVAMVCGPISTGGLCSVEKNLEVLDKAVANLKSQNIKVFEQRPLEKHIRRLCELPAYESYKKGNYICLLEELYGPLFKSGLIHEMHFIPLWYTSVGTKWEHKQAVRLGIKKEYIKFV
ncbi:MAG: hypothetical protein Q7S12_04620, partial [bacterium]|nr:hypothetical protein [bacterium]